MKKLRLLIVYLCVFATSLLVGSMLYAEEPGSTKEDLQQTWHPENPDFPWTPPPVGEVKTTGFGGEVKTTGFKVKDPWNTWNRTYGVGSASAVGQTSDGGYIVAGTHGHSCTDFYILKLDANGNVEWQKIFGENGNDRCHDIKQTQDGGYIMAGESFVQGDYYNNACIAKLDRDGNEEWMRKFHVEGNQTNVFQSVEQTEDSGYIVSGYTSIFLVFDSKVYVVKVDANGEVEWEKTFGYDTGEMGESIEQTTDGGYIVAGRGHMAGAPYAYILKLFSNGELEWEKTFDHDISAQAHSIQQTQDGGYIVAGETRTDSGGLHDAVYVFKLYENGDMDWERTFQNDQWRGSVAHSIQQTQDGSYIVAGMVYKNYPAFDMYILKLSANGEFVWDRTFGGNKEDFAYDIGQTTDGGYIVAGYTLPYQQDETAAYVLKLSPNGELLNGGINFYPSREATINITSHSNIVSLGEPILISVRLVNIGYMIWTMDIFRCGAHAYNERGEQIVEDLEGSGFQLPYDLAYGDEAYLEISIPTGIGTQLPSVGNFQIGLDMIQEGVGWFNNEVRFGCQITNK